MSQPLTDEQSTAVRSWADEGADLPLIQKRLGEDFDIHLTFMDTRFLIADLEIELKAEEEDEEPVVEEAIPEAEAVTDPTQDPPVDDDAADVQTDAEADPAAEPMEKVTVTISELQRPGMMANGNVTFASGQTAEWYLDQMGQLGMNPTEPEFRPSPQQMLAFQKELQRVAQQKGLA